MRQGATLLLRLLLLDAAAAAVSAATGPPAAAAAAAAVAAGARNLLLVSSLQHEICCSLLAAAAAAADRCWLSLNGCSAQAAACLPAAAVSLLQQRACFQTAAEVSPLSQRDPWLWELPLRS
ncbi:hypothetical protein Emed_002137 [Eimeria media]